MAAEPLYLVLIKCHCLIPEDHIMNGINITSGEREGGSHHVIPIRPILGGITLIAEVDEIPLPNSR
jgi:hypothetical protein